MGSPLSFRATARLLSVRCIVPPDAGIRQRLRWKAPRNIGFSVTVSTRALKVAGFISLNG